MLDDGHRRPLNQADLRDLIAAACVGFDGVADPEAIFSETVKNIYDGVPIEEVYKSVVLAARSRIELDPAYSQVSARLLLHSVRREVLGEEVAQGAMVSRYAEYFPGFIRRGIDAGLLNEELGRYDLQRLGAALNAARDLQFTYLGLQTLYDRYFLHVQDARIELPQAFFMRVAMGLALGEVDRETRAIEFYELLSSFDFMSSTPTLFNAGTLRSQLSSCYLTTVADDLDGIYLSRRHAGMRWLYSKNRINVAVSRARCLAVLVVNPALLDIRCQTVEQMMLVNTLCWIFRYASDTAVVDRNKIYENLRLGR